MLSRFLTQVDVRALVFSEINYDDTTAEDEGTASPLATQSLGTVQLKVWFGTMKRVKDPIVDTYNAMSSKQVVDERKVKDGVTQRAAQVSQSRI